MKVRTNWDRLRPIKTGGDWSRLLMARQARLKLISQYNWRHSQRNGVQIKVTWVKWRQVNTRQQKWRQVKSSHVWPRQSNARKQRIDFIFYLFFIFISIYYLLAFPILVARWCFQYSLKILITLDIVMFSYLSLTWSLNQ